MTPRPEPSAELVARYDRPGPRYTSYPTVPVWTEDFGEGDWRRALAAADARADEPLALYLHLPFCRRRCLFCACNVVITRREDVVEDYLARLEREVADTAALLPNRRRVDAVHLGGGTPTHLTSEQLERLWAVLGEHFHIAKDVEASIEVHPPVTTREQLETLHGLGFRRISLGVQDLDPEVQRIIARDQTVAQTERLTEWARELGFTSVNHDLIYGLPGQDRGTWDRTLDEVLRMRPDRLAIYSYAHVPWLHPHQARMPADLLPAPPLKLELLEVAARRLTEEGGYVEIGFDHFALPEDELARAVGERRLYRNFMGYTVKPAPDYLGLGVSAISEVGDAFAQRHVKLNRWSEAVDAGRPAIHRGIVVDAEDRIRKLVIERLMCNQRLEFAEAEAGLDRPFREHFADAWSGLEEMESDGLVVLGAEALEVTELGRRFLRNVCMLFDRHLPAGEAGRFSRTV